MFCDKLILMYVGVDIGGTKTLVAVLDEHGVIVDEQRFETDKNYTDFLEDIKKAITKLKTQEFAGGAAGVPGSLNRELGTAIKLGNLPWQNVPIQKDLEDIFKCPIAIENDAKLGALSEAMLLKDQYNKVLYITISTGIGIGLVVHGLIDANLGDAGGKTIMLEHDGKIVDWEEFASGRAIVARYGKRAEDITDPEVWKMIASDLAKGFIHLVAIIEPEVIVIGGGVGTYFERYGDFLKDDIQRYKMPVVKLPEFIKAQRPEQAVVYGCYDLAKQKFPHAYTHN